MPHTAHSPFPALCPVTSRCSKQPCWEHLHPRNQQAENRDFLFSWRAVVKHLLASSAHNAHIHSHPTLTCMSANTPAHTLTQSHIYSHPEYTYTVAIHSHTHSHTHIHMHDALSLLHRHQHFIHPIITQLVGIHTHSWKENRGCSEAEGTAAWTPSGGVRSLAQGRVGEATLSRK